MYSDTHIGMCSYCIAAYNISISDIISNSYKTSIYTYSYTYLYIMFRRSCIRVISTTSRGCNSNQCSSVAAATPVIASYGSMYSSSISKYVSLTMTSYRNYRTSCINSSSTSNGQTENESAAETAAAAEAAQVTDDDLIVKLQKEVKDLKDQVIRSYAEEENVRRIAKRDVDNAKAYANEKFAKSMLDVADNLERALSALPADKQSIAAHDPVLHTLVEGIVLTEKDLQKVFLQFNVVKYGAVGDVFNPQLHDALFQIPDASKPANTIAQVLKCGYKLKDRVIRAAQVGTVSST